MSKQREEFEKQFPRPNGVAFDTIVYFAATPGLTGNFSVVERAAKYNEKWKVWQIAQFAMQPEIEMWKQYQQNSAIMCNELAEQLSAANQRIEELEAIIKASQEQEPVSWMYEPTDKEHRLLYAAPVIKERP